MTDRATNGNENHKPSRFSLQVLQIVLIVLSTLILTFLTLCQAEEPEIDLTTESVRMELNPNDYFEPDEIVLIVPFSAPLFDILVREQARSTLMTEEELEDEFLREETREITVGLTLEDVAFINLSVPAGLESQNNFLLSSDPPSGTFCPGLPANLKDQSFFAIAQATIDDPDNNPVSEYLQNIPNDPDFEGVIAEPNLVIGSPNYPTGSTSTWKAMPVATREHYDSQWSFNVIERGIPDVTTDGKGVRVVIFDTVPSYVGNAPQDASDEVVTEPTPVSVDWVDPTAPMSLQIGYGQSVPTPVPAVESETEGDPSTESDLGHHGMFVAQMVHAVAPASEIELYRVLNNQIEGNLYSLINTFRETLLATNNISPTVVNMSLGIRIPPPGSDIQLPSSGIEAFRTLVTLANCRNIVVVAAAGNNSIMSNPPELAHLPADWSSVIGVAASNVAHQRSCFSNQGDIAAPGGDGRMPDDPVTSTLPIPLCQDRINVCDVMGDSCPFAIIGPIGPPSDDNETGLIYWNGSSFAAPLVTGLAARVLQKWQAENEGSPPLTPAQVRAIIECGAAEATFPEGVEGHPDRHIGEGVINVKRTLEECLP